MVVATALNLRPAITSFGTVLPTLRLPATAAEIMVALPSLALAAGALFTGWIRQHASTRTLVTTAQIALAATLAARVTGNTTVLLIGTVGAALAIAVISVLLPAIIGTAPAARAGPLTASYTAALVLGAGLGAAVTPVMSTWTTWRIGVGSWCLLPLITLAVLTQGRRAIRHRPVTCPPRPITVRLPWRDQTAWWITGYFAVIATVSMTLLGWIPTLLRVDGHGPTATGTLFGLALAATVPSSILVPVLAVRQRNHAPLVITLATATGAGLLGLALLPGVAWLWCALLGIGLGVISHGFALITRTSPTAAIAANRSAMAQGIGYLLGSVGVLAVGDLHTTSHGWAVPVAFLLVVLAGQIICGLAVRHPGGVGR